MAVKKNRRGKILRVPKKVSKIGTQVVLSYDNTPAKLEAMYRQRLHEIGTKMKTYLMERLDHGKRTGRKYLIKGKWHIASAPGEYPARLTGELRKSIRFEVYKTLTGPQLRVGLLKTSPAAGYGADLEDPGYRHSRPFLRRAMYERLPMIRKILGRFKTIHLQTL